MTNRTHTCSIGTTSSGAVVTLDEAARRRHMHLVGQTGAGKSTLMLNLIAQDMAAGRGLALFDPHGDLAERALASVPSWRAHQLVYLNPADLERPIGFNVLHGVAPDRRVVVADGVVAAFKHVWPEFWGPRLEYILLNAVQLLLDYPGATLLALPRLLVDAPYRARLLTHGRDPLVLRFWRAEYDGYDARFRNEAIAPIQNKIGRLLVSSTLRNILAQPVSSIDIRRMMDEERILIVNLSKGALGEGAAHLLGALLMTTIANAALSRADTPEHKRRLFHVYADEFQSYATDSFALVLSEARKYGLTLTLGHQYLGQLPQSLRQAVLGNTGSFVSFRVGAEDADLLAAHLGLSSGEQLKDLANFRAVAKFLVDGVPTNPLPIALAEPPRPVNARVHRLIANSRIRFGHDRREVEARIARFLTA